MHPVFARLLDPWRLERRPEGTRKRWVRALVVRGLGLVNAVAFASLWVQIQGLSGRTGIVPAIELAAAAERSLGAGKWLVAPSLYWLYPSDVTLHVLCGLGVAAGLAVAVGLLQGPLLLLAWACYLSLHGICQPFLGYQWDTLLLEATFLGLLMAPWRTPLDRDAGEPPPFAMALMTWLLFRVMFFSGYVKLASGDAAWADLSALTYHYWTQPLPNPVAWYVYQLPDWLHTASCGLMLVIELVLPFGILFGRWGGRALFAGTALLMGALAITGNYGFFQLLTAVIALSLLDDTVLERVLPMPVLGWLGGSLPESAPSSGRAIGREVGMYLVGAVGTALLLVSGLRTYAALYSFDDLPRPALRVVSRLQPLRLVNNYGLFAVMTKTRPEVSIEGSADGVTWKEYGFRYKIDAVDGLPPRVAPHQPRVDWQMWSAALCTCAQNGWLQVMMDRLLEQSDAVEALLADDPFGDVGPRYVRAVMYDYRPTEPGESPGDWWVRENARPYCPIQTLESPSQL